VVLTGTGTNFSAGLDLFKIVDGGEKYIKELMPHLTETLLTLFTFPKPVVAAINGHAIAGGCVLACACDVRIMADGDGKIGAPELLVGVPFPVLPLELIRHTVTPPDFQELIYSGKNYLPREALGIGLIDEVVQPQRLMDQAHATAQRLSQIPADAFRITKQIMRQPVLDRYEQFKDKFDPKAEKVWFAPETLQTISQYLKRTLGK